MLDADTLQFIFMAVREAVLSEGGDGWGAIVAENYRELADVFEKYEKELNGNWFAERNDSDDHINFGNNQEFVSFYPSRPTNYPSGYIIILELP